MIAQAADASPTSQQRLEPVLFRNYPVTRMTLATPPPREKDCLFVVYQADGPTGRQISLETPALRIGSSPNNEVVLADPNVSSHHASLHRRGDRLFLTDLGSAGGTLLNNRQLDYIAELAAGDRIKIGSTIFKYLRSDDLQGAVREQTYITAISDGLTQLCSRRYFDDQLASEFSRAKRHQRPLALILLDIDGLEAVNRSHGRAVGDSVLEAVASRVRSCLRADDVAARLDGDQLAVLFPETTLASALGIGERMRRTIATNAVAFREVRVAVTVAIGCVEVTETDSDATLLTGRCAWYLTAAKKAGGDCVRG